MTLVKWEPIREMENLFDRYARSMGLHPNRLHDLSNDWTPRIDVSETENEFIIKVELADVNKEDIHVSVDRRTLTIKGEKKQEKEEKGKKYHHIERIYGSFSRSFTLPENVDETQIKASFTNGLLDLHIAKTAEIKPQEIEVKVA